MPDTIPNILLTSFSCKDSYRDFPGSPVAKDFLGGSDGKNSTCNARGLSLIPGLGRSPGEGHGNSIPVFLPGESPCTDEPGRLQSIGSQGVGHD